MKTKIHGSKNSGIILISLSLALLYIVLMKGPSGTVAGIVADLLSVAVALFGGYFGLLLLRVTHQLPMRLWRVDYHCPAESPKPYTSIVQSRHCPTAQEAAKALSLNYLPEEFESITISEVCPELTIGEPV